MGASVDSANSSRQAQGYSTQEIAGLLKLTPQRVRALVRCGFLRPTRGQRGEYRFSFRDLVLLRSAKGLSDAKLSARRIGGALRKLAGQLPGSQPISSVELSADQNQVVARDAASRWSPETGQSLFDFQANVGVEQLPTLVRARDARRSRLSAEQCYEHGCELEGNDRRHAIEAYRRALEIDSVHADAHINLGRLLHESGEFAAAESHYRQALQSRPHDPTAAFNLAVALDDQGRTEEAIRAYQVAIETEPRNSDSHFNLASLYERVGRPVDAVRHLKVCKTLAAVSSVFRGGIRR